MDNKLKAYYRGVFKIHEVEIIADERYWSTLLEKNYYNYLIRFKNGKLKYVHEEKVVIP